MQIISSSHDCISFDRMKPATYLWGTRGITAPLSASRRFRFIVFRVPYSSFDFLSISHAIRISYLSYVSNIDVIGCGLLHQIGKSSHATIRIVLYQSLWLRLYEFFILFKNEVLQMIPAIIRKKDSGRIFRHFPFSPVTFIRTLLERCQHVHSSASFSNRLLLSKLMEMKLYIRKIISLYRSKRPDTIRYTPNIIGHFHV
jgi:hypothetical protein